MDCALGDTKAHKLVLPTLLLSSEVGRLRVAWGRMEPGL